MSLLLQDVRHSYALTQVLGGVGLSLSPGGVLALQTGLDAGALSAQLLTLELAGHLEKLPGGLFQRVSR